uniref:Uncharacterized protein n=1 Tax=uncultured Thiotrichaceae bacterium TaxID=298394 RepID=A0A6S6UIV0_9GAMM|nr:MAG: Unknown protein [uncultured Thiotrichaceae bacterium]
MKGLNGYIYLETHTDQPGQVRVLTQNEEPSRSQSGDTTQIRYIAKFKNAHIAYMHVHNTLKKKLTNINTRFYATSIPEAIAAIESEKLSHERIWLDPALPEDEVNKIGEHTESFKTSHKRVDTAFLVIGAIGIMLLLFILLGGAWSA